MRCTVPVIASGGVGTLEDLVDGVTEGHASAVLAASIFHFGEVSIAQAKAALAKARTCRSARFEARRLRDLHAGADCAIRIARMDDPRAAPCIPFPAAAWARPSR